MQNLSIFKERISEMFNVALVILFSLKTSADFTPTEV